MNKTYSELLQFDSFADRFRYLKLSGNVGRETFGHDRWINQVFYTSKEWENLRDEIIIRDDGMDLGVPGYPIYGPIIIHHMNPITKHDILAHSAIAIDPEYLICVSLRTHNALHYGSLEVANKDPIERRPYDTCPWKKV